MPLTEDAKKIAERITGYGKPSPRQIRKVEKQPKHRLFRTSGGVPNNPTLPFLHYKGVVELDPRFDPAAIFEVMFAANGWKDSWRDSIYTFLHFHTRTHEVLGIARGHARVQFGGRNGRIVEIRAGDTIVLPAGTGHQRKSASKDLLVVGAYPGGGKYDEPKPNEVSLSEAEARIAGVSLPKKDPVFGIKGPLRRIWRKSTAAG